MERSAREPATHPQPTATTAATTRQARSVSAAGHQTNPTSTTAPRATVADDTSGSTTRSGRFCSSSTSSTRAPSTEPRRVRVSPSGASGMSRRTRSVRVASWRSAASWLASRSV
jgi:hypothetical protein